MYGEGERRKKIDRRKKLRELRKTKNINAIAGDEPRADAGDELKLHP